MVWYSGYGVEFQAILFIELAELECEQEAIIDVHVLRGLSLSLPWLEKLGVTCPYGG